MKNQALTIVFSISWLLSGVMLAGADEPAVFRDLFNGKDLTGWVDVNTSKETWSVRDGLLVCTGRPIGVMRSTEQFENFILHIEWRHMEAGGNSGVFVWSEGTVPEGRRLPKGMEVQMLELDWVNQHKNKEGVPAPIAYVHGELFGANGLETIPDNPRGRRSKSIENRCKGKWSAWTGWSSCRSTASSSTACGSPRSREVTSAWNPRARRSTSAISASWNCRRELPLPRSELR